MSCGHRVAYRQGGSSCFSKAPDQNLCCELPPLFQSQDKHPKHFLFSGNLNIGTTLVIKSPQRLTKGWVLLTCQSPGHFSAYNLLFKKNTGHFHWSDQLKILTLVFGAESVYYRILQRGQEDFSLRSSMNT